MKKVSILLIFVFVVSSCSVFEKATLGRTGIATAAGCLAGLGIGAIYDEKMRGEEAKQRKKDILAAFKKKKQHNKGKLIGLGSGCMIGLGTGLYLDMMASDIEEKMAGRGITLEKVQGNDGETDELLVKMDGDINFSTGSPNLTGVASQNVSNLAEALAAYPDTGVKVYGHTDGTGSRATNERLSLARANSVKGTLVNKSVGADRFKEITGYANDRPLPGTNQSGNEPKNRRVEVRIIGK